MVTRSIAFAASGAMAGLAGALFAARQLFIEPDQFDFTLLIGVLVAVLIGGPGRRFGPVIGAIALTALQRATNGLGSLEGVVYAALLAIIILALPGGLIGAAESLVRRLRTSQRAGRVDAGAAAAGAAAASAALNGSATDLASATEPGVVRINGVGAPRSASTRDRALRLDDVSVQFGGVKAVSDVSLTINPGDVIGLIGPNGAGKTTLVNIATGVLRPSHGEVLLGDERLTGAGPHLVSRRGVTRTSSTRRSRPDCRSWTTSCSVSIELGPPVSPKHFCICRVRARIHVEFRKQAMSLLEPVGIAQYAAAMAGACRTACSGGSVARALACNPDFIFLDEAGAGLSEVERAELIGAIQAVATPDNGPGIVVIEHNIGFVRQLCARSVVLVGGSVLATGDTDAVLRDERVVDAYLGRPIAEAAETTGEPSRG